MMRSVPPRLRGSLVMLVGGTVVAGVAVATYGWGSLRSFGPLILVAAAAYYVWSGRDSDSAAMIRRQVDERQAYRQLRIQAVVGRIMSIGAAVAYLAASAANVTLWPFAVFLALFTVALLTGWVMTREHDGEDGTAVPADHLRG